MNAVTDDSPIRDGILLLSTFHTFMNLLGAIGTLMDGTGLKEIMETVYGENATVHMMSRKANKSISWPPENMGKNARFIGLS